MTSCEWHKGDTPVLNNEPVGCQDCGKLFWTRTCESCGKTFLDWELQGHDDVCSAPYVTEDGDLLCYSCFRAYQQDIEEERLQEWFEEEFDDNFIY